MSNQNLYTIHHVGIAVSELEAATAFYSTAFGFEVAYGPIEDPIQRVKVLFFRQGAPGLPLLELISPLSGDSPLNNYLAKDAGAYHVCYEVPDIETALADLRGRRCLIVSRPVNATAYNGRRIAWCFTPTNQLVELLEAAP